MCVLGWPLANGEKIKVTNLTVPPFEVVPIIIKWISAKYFDDCIIFRGVPRALKFNIENVSRHKCIFKKSRFPRGIIWLTKDMACNDNIYLRYLYSVIYKTNWNK